MLTRNTTRTVISGTEQFYYNGSLEPLTALDCLRALEQDHPRQAGRDGPLFALHSVEREPSGNYVVVCMTTQWASVYHNTRSTVSARVHTGVPLTHLAARLSADDANRLIGASLQPRSLLDGLHPFAGLGQRAIPRERSRRGHVENDETCTVTGRTVSPAFHEPQNLPRSVGVDPASRDGSRTVVREVRHGAGEPVYVSRDAASFLNALQEVDQYGNPYRQHVGAVRLDELQAEIDRAFTWGTRRGEESTSAEKPVISLDEARITCMLYELDIQMDSPAYRELEQSESIVLIAHEPIEVTSGRGSDHPQVYGPMNFADLLSYFVEVALVDSSVSMSEVCPGGYVEREGGSPMDECTYEVSTMGIRVHKASAEPAKIGPMKRKLRIRKGVE